MFLYLNGYNLGTQRFIDFVKQKRKEYALAQVELSEKPGVGIRFVRELEGGKKTLRLDKVNQVLRLFGAGLAPLEMERNSSEE